MPSGRESAATTDKWPAHYRGASGDHGVFPLLSGAACAPMTPLAAGASSGRRHVDDSAVTAPVTDTTPR